MLHAHFSSDARFSITLLMQLCDQIAEFLHGSTGISPLKLQLLVNTPRLFTALSSVSESAPTGAVVRL